MSLRDKVLAVVGDTLKAERAALEAKQTSKAEGTTGTRAPKQPRSKSGEFMNIRHLGEAIMIEMPDILPKAFASYIETEFPESQAALKNWTKADREGNGRGHYPYYRGYVLDGDIKFAEQIKASLEADGVNYNEALASAQEVLRKTITRKKKAAEVAG